MAIREAKIAGLSILATNVGNTCSHVDGSQNGILCNDMIELVQTFEKLSRNKDLRTALYQNAMSAPRSAETTWEMAAEQLLQFLRHVEYR